MSLPRFWITTRLEKIVVDTQPGFAQRPNQENIGIPQLRTNNVSVEGTLDLSEIKYVDANETMIEKYGVQKGDIIFNNTNSPDLVGKTAFFDIDDVPYVISNHMTRIRVDPELVDAKYLAGFLHYLWKSGASKSWARQWVNQAAIDQTSLRKFDVILPPLPEQRRIVVILRQANVLRQWRLDANEKAKEIAKALFYENFGDPDPDYNDRGWEAVKIGSVMDVGTGGTPSRSVKEYYGGEHYWVKSTELKDNVILSTEETLTDRGLSNSNAKIYPINTVLVAMYGQGQTRGRTAKLGVPASVNQACGAFLPSEELLPDYVWRWFQNSYKRIRSMSRGGPQENLNLQILKDLYIPQSPPEIQRRFVSSMEQYRMIWDSVTEATDKIERLLQSIIASAFSGELTSTWRDAHKDELKGKIDQQLPIGDDYWRQFEYSVEVVLPSILNIIETKETILDFFIQDTRFSKTVEMARWVISKYQNKIIDCLERVVAGLEQHELQTLEQYHYSVTSAERVSFQDRLTSSDQLAIAFFQLIAEVASGLKQGDRNNLKNKTRRDEFNTKVSRQIAKAVEEIADTLENGALDIASMIYFNDFVQLVGELLPGAAQEIQETFSTTVPNLSQRLLKRLAHLRSPLLSYRLNQIGLRNIDYCRLGIISALVETAQNSLQQASQRLPRQPGRLIRSKTGLDITTLKVLETAESRPPYFSPDDLVDDDIDLPTVEDALSVLVAVGFAQLVFINNRPVYCLLEARTYSPLE